MYITTNKEKLLWMVKQDGVRASVYRNVHPVVRREIERALVRRIFPGINTTQVAQDIIVRPNIPTQLSFLKDQTSCPQRTKKYSYS